MKWRRDMTRIWTPPAFPVHSRAVFAGDEESKNTMESII